MSTLGPSYKHAYTQLCTALDIPSSGKPFVFEILVESHPLLDGHHVLVEEDSIGMPRNSLRKAYLVAREIFVLELESPQPDSRIILVSSAVLLLYEPEHLTAANARKRILLELEQNFTSEFITCIQTELWFLDSLFQSPLNRHTKSPTLWFHRRWLVQRISRQKAMQCHKEIAVVLSAAQTHPRNYYAWDYLRWWINKNPELWTESNPGLGVPLSDSNNSQPYLPYFFQDWCLKNPSDTSGWTFLHFTLTSSEQTSCFVQEIAKHVLLTAASLKLRNESLWLFLRSLMASKRITPALRQRFTAELKVIAQSKSERPTSRSMAQSVLKGVSRIGQNQA